VQVQVKYWFLFQCRPVPCGGTGLKTGAAYLPIAAYPGRHGFSLTQTVRPVIPIWASVPITWSYEAGSADNLPVVSTHASQLDEVLLDCLPLMSGTSPRSLPRRMAERM